MTNGIKRNFTEDQRICDAATAGPWWTAESEDTWQLFGGPYGERQLIKAPKRSVEYAEYWPDPEDARFITEARTGWPAALERIRVQDAEITRLRKALLHISRISTDSSDSTLGRMLAMDEVAIKALRRQ